MLAVVLDSNAIHTDPWLSSDVGRVLVRLAESGSCTLIVPEVVRDELYRQRRDAARASHGEASKGIRAMARAGVNVSDTDAHLHASFDRIESDIAAAFATLFDRNGVELESTPDVSVAQIVERDLARRRPFQEITHQQKTKSLGFRDVVIWETVLAVLAPDRGFDKVLFVTADKGFLTSDSMSLHADLIEDLDVRGIDSGRLATVKNVPNANAEIEATAAYAAKVTAATNALYELIGEEVGVQLAYGGDYERPDFVEFEVPGIESPYITDITQITEFSFKSEGPLITATTDAEISLEGAIFKGDWFMDDSESIEIVGELNNHYFDAYSSLVVTVIVKMVMDGENPEVISIVLSDPAPPLLLEQEPAATENQ